jgi:sulfur carrier protein ThiS
MRMHRGSSKGAGTPPTPETLPLSASGVVTVELSVVRGGRSPSVSLTVPRGTPIRRVLRQAGHAPEGCAVLVDGVPWPLDRPVERDLVLDVLPTFSGG